ncbi:MAG: PEP-CTERM sorting domain-containing protein [Planctomycetota bacterium]
MKRVATLSLLLMLVLASTASAYLYDPLKQQNSQGYFELATDPVQVTVGGNVGWEYIVDWFTVGSMVTGTTMEMWGFDNDKILNLDTNVSWYGDSWDGPPVPDSRIIMECWSGEAKAGYTTLRPPSIETNGDDVWELTAEPWAMDNPWHVPSEYQGGFMWGYAFHTQEPRDPGFDYKGTGPIAMDVMPIQNFWLSTNAAGLMLTTRIVSTETFGADPGDSPIPQWTMWNDQANMYPILGNWEAAIGGKAGDFDGDLDVDADDIDLLADAIALGAYDATFDVNGDSFLNEQDLIDHIATLVERAGGVGTYRGDFNLDGYVDGTDLAILKAGFGLTGLGYALGNANTDDFVDGTDLAIFKATFGLSGTPGGGNPPAVPEPATMALLAMGGVALLRRRSREA